MLEILALWWLTKRVGAIAKQKGHESLVYQIIAVLLWFGGEIVGGVLGLILSALLEDSFGCLIYLFALFGAVVGGGAAYFIATIIKPAGPTSPSSTFSQGLWS